ncbi:13452_t:CDS:2 [Entrophospora sp. SA101]|nr:14313_t:CDS:2 [Entrophospora sp. SA101]CAJ0847844.1 13452_t:CDS:2 [Entrophospora sp. SA101]
MRTGVPSSLNKLGGSSELDNSIEGFNHQWINILHIELSGLEGEYLKIKNIKEDLF